MSSDTLVCVCVYVCLDVPSEIEKGSMDENNWGSEQN